MASVVFTRGHLGTTHAADRLRARERALHHACRGTRAHSEERAPCLRSLRRVLLEPSPCVESPGEHEDEGLPYVRERTSRTLPHKPRVRRLTNGRGSRRRNRLLNGFYRSPILSLIAPPAPGLLDLARDRSS